MSKIYDEITGLLYQCCIGKAKVELGSPNNFETNKVSITHFEDNLNKILRKYDIKTKKPKDATPVIKETE